MTDQGTEVLWKCCEGIIATLEKRVSASAWKMGFETKQQAEAGDAEA